MDTLFLSFTLTGDLNPASSPPARAYLDAKHAAEPPVAPCPIPPRLTLPFFPSLPTDCLTLPFFPSLRVGEGAGDGGLLFLLPPRCLPVTDPAHPAWRTGTDSCWYRSVSGEWACTDGYAFRQPDFAAYTSASTSESPIV